ncbi:MAG: MoxR family ATPase [Planctomycetota bacterium]
MDPFQAVMALKTNIETVFKGKSEKVDLLLICLLAGGHALLEDVPGVGKTTLAKTLALSLEAKFQRIQFTPDLLPSDVLGVSIYRQDKECFQFQRGPLFANIVLADEINRTTPRTQSSLLEAMNELQVTADGTTYTLPRPFMVLATQNPYEYEGTYPLPESQLDRFLLRFCLGYPAREEERLLISGSPQISVLKPVLTCQEVLHIQDKVQQVQMTPPLVTYLLDLAERTRKFDKIQIGVSPRGVILLSRAAKAKAFLHARDYCLPDDIKSLVVSAWSHRILPKNSMGRRDSHQEESLMTQILDSVPVPI